MRHLSHGPPGRGDDQHVDKVVVQDLVLPTGARARVATAFSPLGAELSHDLGKLLLSIGSDIESKIAEDVGDGGRAQSCARKNAQTFVS